MRLSDQILTSFQDELEKIAVNPLLGSAATTGLIGSLAGGGLNYMRAKQQGAQGVDALKAMGRGALVGGGLGAAGGAGLAAALPNVGGAISRFGQRELHGLTGWKPQGGLAAMRAGSWEARQGMEQAAKALQGAQGAEAVAKARKGMQAAKAQLQAASKVESMGMTSIPGMVRAVKEHGAVPVFRAAGEQMLRGQHPAMSAVQVGLPLAMVGASAMRTKHDAEGGMSRAQDIGYNTGQAIGGVLGTPLPMVGGAVLGEALGRVGKGVGTVVDKFRRKPVQSATEPTNNGQNTPTERIYSDRAMGYTPEIAG